MYIHVICRKFNTIGEQHKYAHMQGSKSFIHTYFYIEHQSPQLCRVTNVQYQNKQRHSNHKKTYRGKHMHKHTKTEYSTFLHGLLCGLPANSKYVRYCMYHSRAQMLRSHGYLSCGYCANNHSLHQMNNKAMPTPQFSLQDRMSRDTPLPLGQEPHKKPAEMRN